MRDVLAPGEIIRLAGKTSQPYHIQVYDCVASTNDLAKEMIRKEHLMHTLLAADKQTAGRGRKSGRVFISPEGGIYVSFIYSCEQMADPRPFLFFAPCVAVCKTIRDLLSLSPVIKWSNDILLDGLKVGGVLSETVTSGGITGAVIGIGVNFSVKPEELPPEIKAGSLAEHSRGLTRNEFIAYLIKTLDKLLYESRAEEYLNEYKLFSGVLGKQIQIITEKETSSAAALDIEADGGLLIKTADGRIDKIYAGDLSIR